MTRPPACSGRAVALVLAVVLSVGCGGAGRSRELRALETAGITYDAAGIASFFADDFGGLSVATLNTSAIPYKVVAAALLMDQEAREGRPLGRDDLGRIFRQFGFLSSERIANWPTTAPPPTDRPLGLVTGMVRGPLPFIRIEAANLGCASCHGGTVYDSTGMPTGAAWLGLPNTSLDLEAFSRAVYVGLKRAFRQPDSLRRRIELVFPEMGTAERWTLSHFLLSRAQRRVAELERDIDAPTPYSNGGPGRTNGVGALKLRLGTLAPGRLHPEHGFISIPELSSRGLRSSLLADGAYAPLGAEHFRPRSRERVSPAYFDSLARIVAFFTVPSMGMRPDDAEREITRFHEVLAWIGMRYRSPRFPGAIDAALARSGGELFDERCASCHGRYEDGPPPRRLAWFPNALSTQAEMGTDSSRWASVDTSTMRILRGTAYGRHMSVRRTGGYVAPILSGLWATAPYLHNGSVPTVWQLMTPQERPSRFLVGGHRLDLTALGIAGAIDADGVYRYPAGYEPWSTPEVYDTHLPGLANRGHEREVAGLSVAQKRALIEYLKGL